MKALSDSISKVFLANAAVYPTYNSLNIFQRDFVNGAQFTQDWPKVANFETAVAFYGATVAFYSATVTNYNASLTFSDSSKANYDATVAYFGA